MTTMDTSTFTAAESTSALRKIKWRILPLLVILYIIAFIDRANVGFAALEMNAALNISAAQFGLVAGLFSVGYFLFEVPSNLLMRKVGARRWIARILVTWGLVAMATGFVDSFAHLAIARTLLGVAEAGFFPCVLLYLTYWFPERERAKVVATFMVALPVSTLIASPLSGFIMDHINWFGVDGWRWVFILEGAPALVLALVTLKWLNDRPADAKWLTTREREWLTATIEAEQEAKVKAHGHTSFLKSLLGIRVMALALIYFSKSVAIYVLAFFTPQIIAGLSDHLSTTQVGWINAVPYGIAAVFMVYWARHSDKTGERRWHVAIPLIVAAGGLALLPVFAGQLIPSMLLLCLIVAATYSTYGPFWSLPSLFLTGRSAAIGLAAINSLANLGGFFGPLGFGFLKQATGTNNWGLAIVSVILLIAAAIVVGARFVRTAEKIARPVGTSSPSKEDN